MEKRLLEIYKQIFVSKMNKPEWAVHKTTPGHNCELIHCSVPFVGKYYDREKTKILLYASAENLSGYNSKGANYLDCDDYAINRHRNWFNLSASNSDKFFPDVHIAPINDGCLSIVTLYIYLQFQSVDRILPSEFLEKIAFANYGKYSIQSDTNQDYAGRPDYLAESHAYIENDIKILKPNYIIMPKKICEADQNFIASIKGDAKIIPIWQMNAGTINRHISRKYPKTAVSELNPVVAEWYMHLRDNGITGKTKENFLSVFSYIDEVMQTQMK